jgi:hypothetical protein
MYLVQPNTMKSHELKNNPHIGVVGTTKYILHSFIEEHFLFI